MAVLVGALEVPGGTLGTTIRINRPHDDRHRSVRPGDDGFMVHTLNPTDPERWIRKPGGRNAHRTLVPLVGNGPWAQALGPTHLAWMWQKEAPEKLMNPAFPELWITFRTNPAISFWDTRGLSETMARFPMMVSFAYTIDETNWMADILLPEATDLESLQLIRLGRTKFVEQYWNHEGFLLRQPVVAPRGDTRDFTWISTEIARRTGLLEAYNTAINRGVAGMPLKGEGFDFSLDASQAHSVDEIWDAICRAATTEVSRGAEVHDLAWFKEHGFYSQRYPQRRWYLYPTLVEQGLRFELPYQERLTRSGRELERRLHEQGIHWWDDQLTEYQFLPAWHDLPGRWERALVNQGARPEDYPFWLVTTKSMQFHASGNASIQLMDEVSRNVRGHGGVVMNAATAARLGIEDGDLVEVASPVRTTRGPAIVNQGIRPDTLLIVGQFDHWATPYAKGIKAPSLNTVAPMSLELTDATGSGSDLVRVSLRRIDAGARP
jgi:phenylacetyl-CoA:acceptor oxidoreductase